MRTGLTLHRDVATERSKRRKEGREREVPPRLLTLKKPYGRRPVGATLVVYAPGVGRKPGLVDPNRAEKLLAAGIAVEIKAEPVAPPAAPKSSPAPTAPPKEGAKS